MRGALMGGGMPQQPNPNMQQVGLNKLGKQLIKAFRIGSDDAVPFTREMIDQMGEANAIPKSAVQLTPEMGEDVMAAYGPVLNDFDVFIDDATEQAFFKPKQAVEPFNNYSLNNKGNIVDQSFVHPSKRSVEPDQMPFEDFKKWREGDKATMPSKEINMDDLVDYYSGYGEEMSSMRAYDEIEKMSPEKLKKLKQEYLEFMAEMGD